VTAVLTSSHSIANHPATQQMCLSASANISIATFTIGAPSRIEVVQYSRTPYKAYPSVDSPRYALWEVMRYERSILV
jgi:hypothetical protein